MITPLAVATSNNDLETMEYLIFQGASFISEELEFSPLLMAKKNNHQRAVEILLSAGAGLCRYGSKDKDSVELISYDNNGVYSAKLMKPVNVSISVPAGELFNYFSKNVNQAIKFYERFKDRKDELKDGVFTILERIGLDFKAPCKNGKI